MSESSPLLDHQPSRPSCSFPRVIAFATVLGFLVVLLFWISSASNPTTISLKAASPSPASPSPASPSPAKTASTSPKAALPNPAKSATKLIEEEMNRALATLVTVTVTKTPTNTASLITNLRSSVNRFVGSIERSALRIGAATQFGDVTVPASLVTQIRDASLSASSSFFSFLFSIITPSQIGSLEEYLVCVRRLPNTTSIELGVVASLSTCSILPQTREVPWDVEESCGVLGLKTCHHRGVNYVRRGLDLTEIATITSALTASSRQQLSSLTLLTTVSVPEHIPLVSLSAIMAVMKEKVDTIKMNPNFSGGRFTRGVTQFGDSAIVGAYKDVDGSDLSAFLGARIGIVAIEKEIIHFIQATTEPLEWHVFRISSYHGVNQLRDLFMIGRCTLSVTNQQCPTDWVVMQSVIDFVMAPDLLLLRVCSKTLMFGEECAPRILSVPHGVTLKEIDQLQMLGWIVAVERIPSLAILEPELFEAPLPVVTLPLSSAPTLDLLSTITKSSPLPGASTLALVSAISKTWEGVVKAFQTTRTSRLVKVIHNEGFDRLVAECSFHRVGGLRRDRSYEWVDDIISELPVTVETIKLRASLHDVVMDTSEEDQWIHHHVLFQRGQDSSFAAFSIFGHSNSVSNRTDWIVTRNYAPSVQWAPDLLLYHQSRSVAGGIFKSEMDIIKPEAVAVTLSEIQALFDFFDMMAYWSVQHNLATGASHIALPSPT